MNNYAELKSQVQEAVTCSSATEEPALAMVQEVWEAVEETDGSPEAMREALRTQIDIARSRRAECETQEEKWPTLMMESAATRGLDWIGAVVS